MNKKIKIEIAVGIIIILSLAIGVVFWLANQRSFGPTGMTCAKEGENMGAQGMPIKCCVNLKQIGGWSGGFQGDCSFPPPTGLTICSNCGDGICNTETGEGICNCPEDCKKTENTNTNNTTMANPASVYCEQNGGKLEIKTAPDGSQSGICKFTDGSECEEWAYYRKECNKTEVSDWTLYKNDQYGFEIKYPDYKYQRIVDKEAWPHAIFLLLERPGAQSYDLAIEVWNKESEYIADHKFYNYKVFKVKGKFITLTNFNDQKDIDKIISTFKISE